MNELSAREVRERLVAGELAVCELIREQHSGSTLQRWRFAEDGESAFTLDAMMEAIDGLSIQRVPIEQGDGSRGESLQAHGYRVALPDSEETS